MSFDILKRIFKQHPKVINTRSKVFDVYEDSINPENNEIIDFAGLI